MGPVFELRNRDKREYRIAVRTNEQYSAECFTNDLHEALLSKTGSRIWKCWNSKFVIKSDRPISINGQSDHAKIADLFAQHFSKVCDKPSSHDAGNLHRLYVNQRPTYTGTPYDKSYHTDVELVENMLSKMK